MEEYAGTPLDDATTRIYATTRTDNPRMGYAAQGGRIGTDMEGEGAF